MEQTDNFGCRPGFGFGGGFFIIFIVIIMIMIIPGIFFGFRPGIG